MIPQQHRKKAGWCAIALTCVMGFEGLRLSAYPDPVGIPTICFGETKGVRLGDVHTLEQCKDLLMSSLDAANRDVERCIHVPMSDERHAALVSFAYNEGGGALCNSVLAKKINNNDPRACEEMLHWNSAGGHVQRGLVARREKERDLCLKGNA